LLGIKGLRGPEVAMAGQLLGPSLAS